MARSTVWGIEKVCIQVSILPARCCFEKQKFGRLPEEADKAAIAVGIDATGDPLRINVKKLMTKFTLLSTCINSFHSFGCRALRSDQLMSPRLHRLSRKFSGKFGW